MFVCGRNNVADGIQTFMYYPNDSNISSCYHLIKIRRETTDYFITIKKESNTKFKIYASSDPTNLVNGIRQVFGIR